jgi:RNA polymerase sigma-70 factor (ECF subfamily)
MGGVVAPVSGQGDTTTEERVALVRLCAHLTGDSTVAEDLAQETLLIAWQNRDTLRDPAARDAWRAGIARNLCRRWLRAHGREYARRIWRSGSPSDAIGQDDTLAHLPTGDDLALDLERDELATLLDRALALLLPGTRDVLVARYVAESPHAEIAARLGVSKQAVSMRLARGTLHLRRILTTTLRHEAAAYGLVSPSDSDAWQETRIWCPLCGQGRLLGRFATAATTGGFALRCAVCGPNHVPGNISGTSFVDVPALGSALIGVTGYKAAFTRVLRWGEAYYCRALARRVIACPKCGRLAAIRRGAPAHWPPTPHTAQMIHLRCDSCRITPNMALGGFVLALPQAQQFWRQQRRMRMLPARHTTYAGRPALLTTFESIAGASRLDVFCAVDDYALIHCAVRDDR